jgi:hypothetical protein
VPALLMLKRLMCTPLDIECTAHSNACCAMSEVLPTTGISTVVRCAEDDTSTCCLHAGGMVPLLRIVRGGSERLEDSGEGECTPLWLCPDMAPMLLCSGMCRKFLIGVMPYVCAFIEFENTV